MSAIAYVVMVIVIVGMVEWLKADARKPPSITPAGVLELRHGNKYRALAVACLIVGPGMMIAALLIGSGWSRSDVTGFAILTVMFAIFGIWMVLDAFRTRVIVSPDGVRALTPFGGDRSIEWVEIERVGYNPFGPWLLLRGSGKAPVRVHRNLLGSQQFLRRLRSEVRAGAFRGPARLLASGPKDAA